MNTLQMKDADNLLRTTERRQTKGDSAFVGEEWLRQLIWVQASRVGEAILVVDR